MCTQEFSYDACFSYFVFAFQTAAEMKQIYVVLQCGINLSSACVSAFSLLDVCDVQLFAAENISSNDS